jgi:hypothetical protein
MSPQFHVERFTCDGCGETTLRSELVVDKNLSILRGGTSGVQGGTSITFNITSSCLDGFGTITPAGTTIVPKNGTQSFTITATGGFKISTNGLVVDGVAVTAANGQTSYVYTFSGVVANHTIRAISFDPI